jgi:hypothetical protein
MSNEKRRKLVRVEAAHEVAQRDIKPAGVWRIAIYIVRHPSLSSRIARSEEESMELTERRAKHWFSIDSEPDNLLTLPPSNTMEKTGDVVDPDYYLIDTKTRVVYRKEQFAEGENLPEELLVRDRRYTQEQIEGLCEQAGLNVVWSRFVRTG